MLKIKRYNGRDCEQNGRLTQHKRFAIAYPNFCSAKTSFMLGTLSEMPANISKGG